MARLLNCIAFGAAITASALIVVRPVHSQTIPPDVKPVCAISQAAFATMFESGNVTLNGVVKPADSRLQLNPDCPFFVWSEQMFLWMTSPAPSRYGGGSHIMFSPSFYTVSPPFTENGEERRKFLQNVPGRPINMFLRATELGPNMLPATLTKSGQLVEVERPDPRKPVPPVVRLLDGRVVPLSGVKRGPVGALQFFSAGKPVQVKKLDTPLTRRPLLKLPSGEMLAVVPRPEASKAIRARKFMLNGVPVFVDGANNVIDVESGQAGGISGVLFSQNGSLIYYITSVNDVFAYSRTMRGAAVIPDNTNLTMPTTAADATAIVNYAAAHGKTITDPEALAIEAKSSWVEASAVPDPQNYISVKATIPTFATSTVNGTTVWTPNGQKTVTLVMVGMHVVGSTLGHGEMVWGSFERFGSTPNASYQYMSTGSTMPVTVPQDAGGPWLFAATGVTGPFNKRAGSWDVTTGTITGEPGLVPNSVLRMHPWGSLPSNASMNTKVMSATASVRNMLLAGDVRRFYYQIGTTWTAFGAAPNGGNEVGTSLLANSTLETYMQAAVPPATGNGTNCFSCHDTNKTTVSHSYNMAKPLF